MSSPPLPFGPASLTGFELELLAPPGITRRELTLRIAGGEPRRVEAGFKYFSLGERDPAGRPVCLLTPAFRALGEDGNPLVTVVDDPTVRAGLRPQVAASLGIWLRTDDVRLAKWIEQHCWSSSEDPQVKLAPLARCFQGSWFRDRLVDRFGHSLVIPAAERTVSDSERVCEVVTRPLSREHRREVLTAVLEAAAALGCTVPQDGGLHLHLDRDPWMSTRRLSALLLRAHQPGAGLREAARTTRRSRHLGPPPEDVLRVAREAPAELSFEVFAAALQLAKVSKHRDLNVLGAVEQFPLHPTIEVRCIEPTLDPQALFDAVERVEAFLRKVAEAAGDGTA